MLIITVFFLFLFELCFKNYGRPNATVPKYYISRITRFYIRFNYFVPRSVNSAVVSLYVANATLDRSGDLQSGRTRVYSEKPSSMVTTRCDAENQVFLATHFDRLRSLFISLHSLSINKSSSITSGETIGHVCPESF